MGKHLFRKVSNAWDLVGGLSSPSKMPGYAYSLPASACIVGSQLASIPGSVCHSCYALRGRYLFPVVQRAMAKRLASLSHPDWANSMAILINAASSAGDNYFRWHDSGDLQSTGHLRRIVEVAMATPSTHHWLPTREAGLVHQFLNSGGNLPFNLTVRVSSHMVDASPPPGLSIPYVTSTVHTLSPPPNSHVCPAPTQGGKCGNCRACWTRTVQNISYLKH